MPVQTRRMKLMKNTKKNSSARKSVKRVYRKRVKASVCRGKKSTICAAKRGCKSTKAGKRKSYCRKSSNKHVK